MLDRKQNLFAETHFCRVESGSYLQMAKRKIKIILKIKSDVPLTARDILGCKTYLSIRTERSEIRFHVEQYIISLLLGDDEKRQHWEKQVTNECFQCCWV